MPMIDVTAVSGTFSDKPELIKNLTAALMRWEQVPSIPWFVDNTAAFVHDLGSDALATSGGDSNYVRVELLTPVGVLDRDKKLGVVKEMTEIVAAAAGDPGLAERTWVLISEAPDGGWGIDGHAYTNVEIRRDRSSTAYKDLAGGDALQSSDRMSSARITRVRQGASGAASGSTYDTGAGGLRPSHATVELVLGARPWRPYRSRPRGAARPGLPISPDGHPGASAAGLDAEPRRLPVCVLHQRDGLQPRPTRCPSPLERRR